MQYLLISAAIDILQMALFLGIGIIILDLLNLFFGSKCIVDNNLPKSEKNLAGKTSKK